MSDEEQAGTGGGQVGLPAGQRRQIAAALRRCLDAIPEGQDPQRGHDAVMALLAEVYAVGGHTGLFELASEAVLLIAGGPGLPVDPDGNAVRYLGHGRNEVNANPTTPAEYQQAEFGTAIMGGDRARGWRLFCHILAPGARLDSDSGAFLSGLIVNAWSRHHGGGLMIRLESRNWPPVCDFCCGPTATAMWYVQGADMDVEGPDGRPVTIRQDDFEHWYGCPACKALVARKQPQWDQVWARHRRFRPDAHREMVFPMFAAYQRLRRGWRPVPLPAQRPEPTPGRL
jgi:hypothetical protein